MKCYRCGNEATETWNICSDGNRERYVCTPCDIELNELVLKFFGFRQWKSKMKRYKKLKSEGEVKNNSNKIAFFKANQ
jgi:transposase-like protein